MSKDGESDVNREETLKEVGRTDPQMSKTSIFFDQRALMDHPDESTSAWRPLQDRHSVHGCHLRLSKEPGNRSAKLVTVRLCRQLQPCENRVSGQIFKQ